MLLTLLMKWKISTISDFHDDYYLLGLYVAYILSRNYWDYKVPI